MTVADHPFVDPYERQPDDPALLAAYDSEFGRIMLTEAAPGEFIDWAEFWDGDTTAADWLYRDVFARGRGHALYAAHKGGKSLFTLYVAARLATGPEPVVVVYLDYEMNENDLRERLEDMGHGPGSDLGRLHYDLLPSLPALDTAAGAAALDALLSGVESTHPGHHLFVVIDTTARTIEGKENDSDTFIAWFRHTGYMLKRRGCTWVRLDHSGKDPAKAQRGSSSKGDDVDIVWRLTRTEDGIQLAHGGVTRITWAPERVAFHIDADPLRYVHVAQGWPAGTKDTADDLDQLGVDLAASGADAMAALRAAGKGRARAVVLAALRYRRNET